MELTITKGAITETLTPRQRLYGSPYAFTLMPGAVISGKDFDTTLIGASGIEGVLTIENTYDGSTSNLALPALRVIGETGLELSSPTSLNGAIFSDQSKTDSNLELRSRNNVRVLLDTDNNGTSGLYIYSGNLSNACYILETGALVCSGTKSGTVKVQNEQRLMYAIESPEVWFEDFGSSTLVNGSVEVNIESLFADTVSLDEYHVFLTPLGDCNGLYVKEKSATAFTVAELNGGSATISFDYRIVAKRSGYEAKRMEIDQAWLEMQKGE